VTTLPDGYLLSHLAQVDSTNDEARRMAEQGVGTPHWIVADRQTAGRGRRGRNWASPSGNLMTTLYLPAEDLQPNEAGQLAFVAGLALESTVRHFIGARAAVSLKWPNDVLIDGKKASGILLESHIRDTKLNWLAIGLGLNLVSHPDDTPYPATDIAAIIGQAPSNLQALEVLAAAFDVLYRQWRMGSFATMLQAWRAVAHGLGGPMVARLENREIEGIFLDIDETGALLLKDGDETTHIIEAGDVFFPLKRG
jgi:BirA family biotin operon repressor/biotin-[acetyl-CoA-carboxylase] ligase